MCKMLFYKCNMLLGKCNTLFNFNKRNVLLGKWNVLFGKCVMLSEECKSRHVMKNHACVSLYSKPRRTEAQKREAPRDFNCRCISGASPAASCARASPQPLSNRRAHSSPHPQLPSSPLGCTHAADSRFESPPRTYSNAHPGTATVPKKCRTLSSASSPSTTAAP